MVTRLGEYGEHPTAENRTPIDLLHHERCPNCQSELYTEEYSHGRTEKYKGFICKLAPNFVAAFGYAEYPCTEKEALFCTIAKR